MYSKYHKVSFHLNTMTAHYTCTLFKLLYRRYKLIDSDCLQGTQEKFVARLGQVTTFHL